MPKVNEDELRREAEGDLVKFIKLVAPHLVLGEIHKDVCQWWTREDALSHQLLLLPRAHLKSTLIACRVAHRIVCNPAVTVLYISATATLAETQLSLIKQILESPWVRRLWPKLVNPNENNRARWNNQQIIVDHPIRKTLGIRDATVYTAGITANITGLHFDITVFDDLVTRENSSTQKARDEVAALVSLIASIENPDSCQWVVGTRYHPKDIYGHMAELTVEITDEDGNIVSKDPLYEVKQHEVEDSGDGTGIYLWPRQRHPKTGTWYGFNQRILATKKAQYFDQTQFYAQYYNNPNMGKATALDSNDFQYYDPRKIERIGEHWHYLDKPLNVYAAIDFAFSMSKRADYTAVVVVGMDPDRNIYVLDIDRFKSDKIDDYFKAIQRMYLKWDFIKLRAEVSVGQAVIVKQLKDTYLRPNGLMFPIDEYRPSRHEGTKEERIRSTLEPFYNSGMVFHPQNGAYIDVLEEELVSAAPPHDDVKDAYTGAVSIAVPARRKRSEAQKIKQRMNRVAHSRFGGAR